MRCVNLCVCAAAMVGASAMASADFDAIGPSAASTNGGFWLTSATNTDAGGDATTACGVGVITVPPGRRPTKLHAIIGTRGPGGGGSISLAAVPAWQVHFWSSESAFAASPTSGNVMSGSYAAPFNATFTTPYGTDQFGRPTYLVKFRLPGGLSPSQVANSYFAVRTATSVLNTGSIGVLESTATGPSGLWSSQTLAPPGYIAFGAFAIHNHNGVFAYRVVAGCAADFNSDGTLAVQDIFDFLNAWFAGSPAGDFNGGGLTVGDIFDFLNSWFGGC